MFGSIVTVSTLAAGSQRSSGAWTRRSLSICCVAVMELLLVKAPVAAVEPTKNWAKSAVALSVRSDRTDVLLQPDAAGGEAGQQRPVFGANGRGGVLDLQIRCGALQQRRLQEARGGEGIHRQVRRGRQGRSPGRCRWPSELKLAISGFAPGPARDLQRRTVAQNRLGRAASGTANSGSLPG